MKCQHSSSRNSANVHIACGPFFELDFDETIRQAKSMFNQIYPNDEFLPRAPDPEEIIIEGDAAPTLDASDSLLIDANDTLPVDVNYQSIGDRNSVDTGNDGSNDACGDTACSDTG